MAAPRPRLIVHLGLAKTGTTSLQTFLARNATALLPRFAVHTPIKGTPTQKMGRAAMDFSLDPGPERKKKLVAAIAAVAEEIAAKGQDCLISHENLPGAVPGNGATRKLYPQITRILDLLDQGLAPFVPEYTFYTRDMADWKRSVHGQVVISDRYTKGLDAYLADMADCGTWDDLQARIAGHLGAERLRVFRLEDETSVDHPGQQLLRFAGLSQGEIDALQPIQRHNVRVVPGALEFVRQLNRMGLDRPVLTEVIKAVTQNQPLFNADWAKTKAEAE